MAYGKGQQLENKLTWSMFQHSKPWRMPRKSMKYYKKMKHRRERQRIRINPEAVSEYGIYDGWEW
jgi:hypothetical protein